MSTILAPFWLIVIASTSDGLAMEKVPMPSLAACEEAALELPGTWGMGLTARTYCIKGE